LAKISRNHLNLLVYEKIVFLKVIGMPIAEIEMKDPKNSKPQYQ